jgi:hypothetical protein
MQWLLDVDEQSLRDLERPAPPERSRSGGRIAYRSALVALSAVVIGEVALLAVPGLKDQLLGLWAATSAALPMRPPAANSARPSKTPAQAVVVVGPMSPLPASPPAASPLVTGVAPHQPAPRPLPAPATVTIARPSPPLTVAPHGTAASARLAAPLPHPVEAAPAPAPPQPAIVEAATKPHATTVALAVAAPLAHPVEPAPSAAPPQPAVVTAAPEPHASTLALAVAAPLAHPIEAAPSPTLSQPALANPQTVPQPVAAAKEPPHSATAAPQPKSAASAGPAEATPKAKPEAHAAIAATAPLDQHLRVELSFTADEAGAAADFAHRLRREGFAVTSHVIPVTLGRWPGVAFFFDSDRAKARAIAQQLGMVTRRHEHARLSPRHPYPKAGTVEVSLLGDRTTQARSSGKPDGTPR